jgi:hypothetical protein
MTVDAITRLAAANPVLDSPALESPERLRRLIEDDAPTIGLDQRHPSPSKTDRSRIRRRALVAIPICLAASVAGVVLSSGSSGPGVNVAAAAYAATSPQPGIVEAVFFARVFRGSQAGSTLRQREWRDTQTGQRRMQNSTTGPYGDTRETHTLEMVFAPKRWETWSAGSEANVITLVTGHIDMKIDMQFNGIALDGLEGINLYRQLYRLGGMKLVGRERHEGRLLWKLESRSIGHSRADGRVLAIQATHMRLVVLVNPNTFLPVSERQVDVALPGRPTIVESNLISYRNIGGEPVNKLFDLAAQHPSARVRTKTVQSRFVPTRRHRHSAKRP